MTMMAATASKVKDSFCHFLIISNITEVVRQSEFLLIKAVNELCDGAPSEETMQFLHSLDRPLDVPDEEVTKLFGTNFDTCVVNQDMLEELPGEMFCFKAQDEGETKLLRSCVAPKNLLLKEGAKVILIKNIGNGLCNGLCGIVEKIERGSPPIINFNGNLVKVEETRFEIFDTKLQKTLASRKQIPLILAFALTVHRAQGQTLNFVEIDCYSFFAPGQMGVAVGRATNTSGLRIVNLNSKAANTKHPDVVYQFYNRHFTDFSEDMFCCSKHSAPLTTVSEEDTDPGPSTASLKTEMNEELPSRTQDPGPSSHSVDEDLPQLESPWDFGHFITEHENLPFMAYFSEPFFHSDSFRKHVNFLYFKVHALINESPKSSQQWIQMYTKLNSFLTSVQHISSLKALFHTDLVNKQQNKLSTKIVFWLMDKEISKRSETIIKKQTEETEKMETSSDNISAVGKGKIRYIAGACIQRIGKRIRESVLRKVGKTSKKSKILRKLEYKKQSLLKNFRISEKDVDVNQDSMAEIEFKQGPSRGLTIVSDPVYDFFVLLNSVVQKNLTPEHFHLYHECLHKTCRNAIDADDALAEKWISLFENADDNEIENEIFMTLIMELFQDVTEHFVRISFVDALQNFKRTVPRKKKQALRTKVQALGERDSSKAKKSKVTVDTVTSESEIYICHVCNQECKWEPALTQDESVACDKCNCWFHYKCVNLKGTESFLTKQNSTWFCTGCSKKGKGRGKGRGKRS